MTGVLASAALALVAGACADAPSTGPGGTRPERLTAISPLSATVEAASESGVPLRVRVLGSEGNPREGVEVRFLLSEGPGRVLPATASTGDEGRARTVYLPGGRTGEARVRVDVPSAPWIGPLTFRRVARPARRVLLSAAGGDGQRAEAGSQLPRPLAVTARTPSGDPAAGLRVAWEVADAPASAALSADTVLTDAEGSASVLLTLADEPGEHRVRALPAEPAAGDTARFRAEAVRSLDSGLRLDSVRPSPPRAGEEATLFGQGLDAASELWVDGTSGRIDGGSAGRLRVRLPEPPGCRPRRLASLRVRSGEGAWSNGLEAELAPAEPAVEMAVGEALTLAAPGPAECLRLPPATGREYRLSVVSAERTAGARTPLAVRVRAGLGGLEGNGRASAGAREEASSPARAPRAESARPGRTALELRTRLSARAELEARGARPAARSAGARPRGRGAAASRREAATGDTLRLNFAVDPDGAVSCTDTTGGVVGVVRAVGPEVAVVQDTASPPGFTGQDLRLVRDEFGELVLPTDTAYFGPPADIDGNGRLLVLLTPRVNDLTPPGSEARVGGFFLPLDLADAGPGGRGLPGAGGATCPASNEGELLYLATPDPEGAFGPPLDRAGALRNARSIGAHELEHLLSAEQRLIFGDGGFDDLQRIWLAEGMAHLAEEVVGHAAVATEPGSNLDFGDFRDSRDRLEAFNVFHLQNFGRLQLFLRSPARTPALAAVDPRGAASLRMRGFAWLFSRWLADRHAAGQETRLFRELSRGGEAHLKGVENVESVTGRSWRELLLDFVRVPLLDDREFPAGAGPPASGTGQLATWNLPALYEGLRENPSAGRLFPVGYPLEPLRLGALRGPLSLDLAAGAPAYFAVGGPVRSPALAVSLSGADRGPPPAAARLRLTVVRLR